MSSRRAWARPAGLVAVWIVVAAVAVTVGVVAVTRVGATLSDRGPLGNQAARNDLREGRASPDPAAPMVERTFTEEFGEIDVACQGAFAIGLDVRPDEAQGWRTISFETEPDDDIDAVFAKGDRSIEIEVFCNLGEPAVSEVERSTLAE
ncbi:hypothetical protein [Nocardioides sp. Soil777]|uniref:hypothetical protein n=1 Tax=Nocardioides sp. Soil777 TaxID=1736409 RepID=UPI0012FB8B1D|nr:hypothetical protein [Nocardioides sp. Soil777]